MEAGNVHPMSEETVEKTSALLAQPTHRTVSFANKLEYPFDGTTFASGVCLGDVDNDGGFELVAASTEGQLSVFKGSQPTPWRGPVGQGTYTCVTVGDVKNHKANSIVCVTAEGVCSILELDCAIVSDGTSSPGTTSVSSRSGLSSYERQSENAEPFVALPGGGLVQRGQTYTQQIPVNTKVLLLADVDNDGYNELVIGKTDRAVLTYRWSKDDSCLISHWIIDFPQQVGSIAPIHSADGFRLGVSQPGGALTLINQHGEKLPTPSISVSSGKSNGARQGLETQVLGCIKWAADDVNEPQLTAICTSAGLLRVGTMESVSSEFQFDNRLFALSKVDMTSDGLDEIVACAWDGYTVAVDRGQNTLRYDFGREVSAFVAGQYAVEAGYNQPSLVYVTLQQPETKECVITIFHNLGVSSIQAQTLATSKTKTMLSDARDQLQNWGVSGCSVEDMCKELLSKGPRLVRDLEGRIHQLVKINESIGGASMDGEEHQSDQQQ